MNRRHFILGAVALAVAAGVAVVRPGQAPTTQVVSAVQTATTTTTIDPTRPTVTVYLLGEKHVIPLPPGVPDPATIPPGEGVTNVHVPVTHLPPETIKDIFSRLGITTTTRP